MSYLNLCRLDLVKHYNYVTLIQTILRIQITLLRTILRKRLGKGLEGPRTII